MQSAIYTGPQGARGKDAAVVEQQPGRIVFRTTGRCRSPTGSPSPRPGRKGVVMEPTRAQQIGADAQGRSRRC